MRYVEMPIAAVGHDDISGTPVIVGDRFDFRIPGQNIHQVAIRIHGYDPSARIVALHELVSRAIHREKVAIHASENAVERDYFANKVSASIVLVKLTVDNVNFLSNFEYHRNHYYRPNRPRINKPLQQ